LQGNHGRNTGQLEYAWLNPMCITLKKLKLQVMAFSRKAKDQEPPHHSVQAPTEEKQSKASQPSKAPHRRKGKPQRAPFF